MIGETDPMPLLEAVGFLESETGSEKYPSTPSDRSDRIRFSFKCQYR